MAPIIPSDVPYVIGFVVLAILLIWLVGLLGQRGLSNSSWRALLLGPLCLYFVYEAIRQFALRDWRGAALAGLIGVITAHTIWLAWREERARRARS